jgi:lipopolysaccharide transport system permease protein
MQEKDQSNPEHYLLIRPVKELRLSDLLGIFRYRELLYFLTLRDIKVKYKQTVFGILWVLIQPLALMLLFTVVFGKFARLEQDLKVPYSLFALTGLLPWQLFSRTLTATASSLLSNENLISKIYFPRMIVPLSSCLSGIVDFLIGFAGLAVMMICYYSAGLCPLPTANILFLPLFLILMMMTALGIGFWLSALYIEYRDVGYIVPFLVQFWMFATPVVYPVNIIPNEYLWIVALNPMTGVIEGIRWSLFDYAYAPGKLFFLSLGISIFTFISGAIWFHCREKVFADYIGK